MKWGKLTVLFGVVLLMGVFTVASAYLNPAGLRFDRGDLFHNPKYQEHKDPTVTIINFGQVNYEIVSGTATIKQYPKGIITRLSGGETYLITDKQIKLSTPFTSIMLFSEDGEVDIYVRFYEGDNQYGYTGFFKNHWCSRWSGCRYDIGASNKFGGYSMYGKHRFYKSQHFYPFRTWLQITQVTESKIRVWLYYYDYGTETWKSCVYKEASGVTIPEKTLNIGLSFHGSGGVIVNKFIVIPEAITTEDAKQTIMLGDEFFNAVVKKLFKYKIDLNTIIKEIEEADGETIIYQNIAKEKTTTLEYDLTSSSIQLPIIDSKGFYKLFKDVGLVINPDSFITLELPEEFTFDKNFKIVAVFQLGDIDESGMQSYSIISGGAEVKASVNVIKTRTKCGWHCYTIYYHNFCLNMETFANGYRLQQSYKYSYTNTIGTGTYGALVIEKVDDTIYGRIYRYTSNGWVLSKSGSITLRAEWFLADTKNPIKLRIYQSSSPAFVKKLFFTTDLNTNDLDIINMVEISPLISNLDSVTNDIQEVYSMDFYNINSLEKLEQDGWTIYKPDQFTLTPLGLEVKRLSKNEPSGILLEREVDIDRLGKGLTIVITGFDYSHQTASFQTNIPPTTFTLYPNKLYSNTVSLDMSGSGGVEYAQVLIYDTSNVKVYKYVFDETTQTWKKIKEHSWPYNTYTMFPLSDLDKMFIRITRNNYYIKYKVYSYGSTIFSRVRIYSGVPADVDSFVSNGVPPLTPEFKSIPTQEETIEIVHDFTQMSYDELKTIAEIYKEYYRHGRYYPDVTTTPKGLALINYGEGTSGFGIDINKDSTPKTIYLLINRRIRAPKTYIQIRNNNYEVKLIHDEDLGKNHLQRYLNTCSWGTLDCGYYKGGLTFSTTDSDYMLYKITVVDYAVRVSAYTVDNGIFEKQWEHDTIIPLYGNVIRIAPYLKHKYRTVIIPIIIVTNGYEEGIPDNVKQTILDKLTSYQENLNPTVVYDKDLGSESIDSLVNEGWNFYPGTGSEWLQQQFGALYLFPDRCKVGVETPDIGINQDLLSTTGATVIVQGYWPIGVKHSLYDPDSGFVYAPYINYDKYFTLYFGGYSTSQFTLVNYYDKEFKLDYVTVMHLRTTEQIVELYTYNPETNQWELVYSVNTNIPLFNVRRLIILGCSSYALILKRLTVLNSFTTPEFNTLAQQLGIKPLDSPNRELTLKKVIDFSSVDLQSLIDNGLLKGDKKKIGNFLIPMKEGLYHVSYLGYSEKLSYYDGYLNFEFPMENSEEVTLFIEFDALTKGNGNYYNELYAISNGKYHYTFTQFREPLNGYNYQLDENVTKFVVKWYTNRKYIGGKDARFNDYTGSREYYNHFFIIASFSRINTQIRFAKLNPETGEYSLSNTLTYRNYPINTGVPVKFFLWSVPSIIRKIYYYSGALDLSQDFNLLEYVTPSEPLKYEDFNGELTPVQNAGYTLYDFTDDVDLTEFKTMFEYDSINENYIAIDNGVYLKRYCCSNLHYNIGDAKTIAVHIITYYFDNYHSTFDLIASDHRIELDTYHYYYSPHGTYYELLHPAFYISGGVGYRPFTLIGGIDRVIAHRSANSYIMVLRFTENFIRVDSIYYDPNTGEWATGFNGVLPPLHKISDVKLRINTNRSDHKLFKILVSPDIMDLEEIKTIMIGS